MLVAMKALHHTKTSKLWNVT